MLQLDCLFLTLDINQTTYPRNAKGNALHLEMRNLSKIAKVEPSIFHGLFNNVRFEPWTEFQTIMSKAMKTLEQLEKPTPLDQSRRFSMKWDPFCDDIIPKLPSVLKVLSRPTNSIEYFKNLLDREIDFVWSSIEAAHPDSDCKIRGDVISSEHIFRNASKDMILVEREKNPKKGQNPASSAQSQTLNSEGIPLKPLIPLNQVSDRWVFRLSHDEPTEIPVCCYQFEDLGEDITGILPFYRYVYPQDNGDPSENDFDVATECAERTPSEMYISGASPEQVAAHFNNTLFSLSRDSNEIVDSEQNPKRVISIAQAISRAILTKTGCIYLTNHEMSLALQVKEDPAAETFGAKVLVTGAFPPSKKSGRSDAMFSLTKYCFDMDAELQEKELLDPIRRLIMGFSLNAYNSINRIVPLHPSWLPGEVPFLSRDQESSPKSKNSGRTKHNENHDVGSPRTTNLVRSDEDKLLGNLFCSTKGLLAGGNSGVVVYGIFEGEAVAIKTWNRSCKGGFIDLRREIRTYREIQEKYPALPGSVIPTLKIGWDSPDAFSVYHKELILVTGLMGTEISKFGKTIRVLEGSIRNVITSEERDQIRESAVKSLEQLHNSNIGHGDIAFRNMRVARNKTPDESWKVWWVDLGRAFFVGEEHRHCLAREVRACRNMFD